jgi:signal transduction histidine kinase
MTRVIQPGDARQEMAEDNYAKMKMMKKSLFDTSLLSMFRFFIFARLVYSVFTFIVPRLFYTSRFPRLQTNSPASLIGIGESLLLLGFLSWPWLKEKMGRWYLPVALGIATIGPIIENYLSVDLRLADEFTQILSVAGQWQVVILLFIPLIFISWQYSFKVVAAWCGFQALLQVVAILPTIFEASPRPFLLYNILLFRSFIFLLVGYIIVRLVAGQRQQYTRLAQANRQLASYAVTLEQLTTSRERNRMARELHDTLAHTLSAVSIELEAVNALWDNNPGKAKVMLDQSLTMTRDGLNESRRAIQSLRAAPLDDLGLSIALGNLARSMCERIGLVLDLQIPDDLPALGPEVEHSLYRISEEALRNVAEHANATHVSVHLWLQDHQVMLTIKDDGCGFDEQAGEKDHRYGLRGMHEYASTIGAVLTVNSIPQQGTTIHLSLEVKDDPGFNL